MISKNLLRCLSVAMTVVATVVSAWEQPKEYRVSPWGVPDSWSEGYPQLEGAKPGDIVSFHWTDSGYDANSDYNVYLNPTESCADEDGKELVGSTSGSNYVIKEWDQGKLLHFACDTGDYCERGMSIAISVSAGSAPAPTGSSWGAAPTPWPTEWVAPTDPPTKSPTPWPTAAPTYANTAPPTPPPTNGATQPPTENNQAAVVEPKEILIDNWVIPEDTQPFPPIEANVGDTIKWTIDPGHDVWYHPSLTCDRTGSTFVGDATEGGSYIFKPEDGSVEGKQHLFACQVGSHCDLGMQLLVTVFAQPQGEEEAEPEPVEGDQTVQQPSETKNLNLEWLIPGDQPYEPVDMNVGDSITFTMEPGHNVFIHPSGSCDQTDAIFVGDETVTYTFKPEDGSPNGTPMFFACDIGSHCDLGMQVAVNVFSQANDSSGSFSSQNPPSNPSSGEADRVSGREIFIDWEIPEDNQAFDPIEAVVGDTIIFSWQGQDQNVFIHPSLTCDETLSIFVGLSAPTAYTFEPSDGSPEGKEHLFVSDVGSNCELGMQLLVRVYSASEVTSDETNISNPSSSTNSVSSASTKALVAAVSLVSMWIAAMFVM